MKPKKEQDNDDVLKPGIILIYKNLKEEKKIKIKKLKIREGKLKLRIKSL